MKQGITDYNERADAVISEENVVGLIHKPYGNSGEVIVKLLDTFPEEFYQTPDGLSDAQPLWVELDSMATPLFVTYYKTQGVSKAVIRFQDFDTPQASQELLGAKLYSDCEVFDDQFEEDDDDETWEYLEGFKFKDLTNSVSGEIVEFVPNSLSPLLLVTLATDNSEHYIPIDEKFIEKQNPKKQEITLRLPEGIFSINESGE